MTILFISGSTRKGSLNTKLVKYSYNYAIDNYDFDPRFLNFHIPLPAEAQLSDTYFNDPDHNTANDWQFTRTNDVLNVVGSASNEQGLG